MFICLTLLETKSKVQKILQDKILILLKENQKCFTPKTLVSGQSSFKKRKASNLNDNRHKSMICPANFSTLPEK